MKGVWLKASALAAGLAVAGAAAADYRLIAKLRAGTDPGLLAAAYGVRFVEQAPGAPYFLFSAETELAAENAELGMATHPGVAWVEDDDEASITESTNGKGGSVPQLRQQTIGLQFSSGAMYAQNSGLLNQISWRYERTSSDNAVRVAILDTGLSPAQPSLWARTVASLTTFPRERNAYDVRLSPALRDPRMQDLAGHGTMVAGIVANLAPDSELIIVRVADNYGFARAWNILKGLAFAMEQGARIANLSFGSFDAIPALSEVLDDVEASGMVIVGPLGNNGLETALYPSRYSSVVAVSGVDPEDRKASFSNWHGTADMAAPATGIKSAWWNGQMAVWHGTSFASPIVAGCLAEALKERPDVTPSQIKGALEAMGDDIDPLNPEYASRLGPRVNMARMRAVMRGL